MPTGATHDLPGHPAYAGRVTAAVSMQSGPSNVRMTPSAIEALRELERPQAESVARAIAAIGQAEGKPVVARDDGKQYLVMVPDDEQAPVVTYREDGKDNFLVTALIDRGTYETFEITERPGFLQSSTFKATVGAAAAAALGIILGSRFGRSS